MIRKKSPATTSRTSLHRPPFYQAALQIIFLVFWLLAMGGCANLHETVLTGDGDTLQKALEKGADANAADSDGVTLLMLAAEKNDVYTLQLLLDYGADPMLKDKKGRAALNYACQNEAVAAFRLLLIDGAVIPESMDRPAENSPFALIFEEYHLFRAIADANRSRKIKAFDDYFSRFSDGIFQEQAEQMLEQAMLEDIDTLGESPDPKALERFIQTYSSMGRNQCLITARTLNIRAGRSRSAEQVGAYQKGDVVFCKSIRDGWIETDRGWISRQYTRMLATEIPVVARRIEELRHHWEPPEPSTGVIIGKPHPSYVDAPRISPRNAEYREALSAFELLMEHPTLPALEQFILTYKDHPRCHGIVATARKTYVNLLLNQ